MFGLLVSQLALGGAKVCWNDLPQDLNCNGTEAAMEEAVDLSDPLCQEQTDANGDPYPNADYYIEYKTFGCLYPIAEYDLDLDGLTGGTISLPPDALQPDLIISLGCDNCEGSPTTISSTPTVTVSVISAMSAPRSTIRCSWTPTPTPPVTTATTAT